MHLDPIHFHSWWVNERTMKKFLRLGESLLLTGLTACFWLWIPVGSAVTCRSHLGEWKHYKDLEICHRCVMSGCQVWACTALARGAGSAQPLRLLPTPWYVLMRQWFLTVLEAGSWDVLGGNPVPVGTLPKILVTVIGLRLQWGVASLYRLSQALWAAPLQILPLFPDEGNIPCSAMPFKLFEISEWWRCRVGWVRKGKQDY